MVSVGINPSEEQVKLYNQLKVDKTLRCIVLALNKDRNGLETIETHDRNFTLKDLHEKLPKNDCRYVIFDFEYETKENPPRATSKLLLILWCPDIAPIKVKVPFTSTKNDIKAAFVGIQKDILASDLAILDHDELRNDLCV